MNHSFASWRRYVFETDIPFGEKADAIFRHQAAHQPQYRKFVEELSESGAATGQQANPGAVNSVMVDPWHAKSGAGARQQTNPDAENSGVRPLSEIPLIPIQVFRDAVVRAGYVSEPQVTFRSSGTSGARQSTHQIADLTLYQESCYRGFSLFYDPAEFTILACLPGYSDNPQSSLIAMIDHFVRSDASGKSRFLPLNRPLTGDDIREAQKGGRRVMLFGAAFGLLDLIDMGSAALPHDAVVVETGGMKTHRREMPKEELRRQLADGFGLPASSVHSEYGMAEMCSQAWDTGEGRFRCPPWLRISIRNPRNPMEEQPPGEEGLIGVMDLANVHSISFFLTQDRGVADGDGAFEVLGRWDHAALRGCNFLME